MPMARRVKWFLDSRGVDYELIHHRHTQSSLESAAAAHIAGERVAKCVLLEDERGYVMAILPASHRIALDDLGDQLRRDLELASEPELGDLFGDCEVGAVPATGAAYGIPVVVDESLLEASDIYFEGGDHEDLVHLSAEDFAVLIADARRARFSWPG